MTTSQSNQNEKKNNKKKKKQNQTQTDVLYSGRFHVNEPYALYKQRMEGEKNRSSEGQELDHKHATHCENVGHFYEASAS